MNTVWTGILGGLIGSILTQLISKMLEIYKDKKSHFYSLQKAFFEKKLNAAELAMGQYSILSSAIMSLTVLYNRLNISNSEDDDEEIVKYLHSEISKNLEVANGANFIVANSIRLYFDFGSEFEQSEVVKEFYEQMQKVTSLSNQSSADFDRYLTSIGSATESTFYDIYRNTEEKLQAAIGEAVSRFEQFKGILKEMMNDMRNEIRKFEY